MDYDVIVVGARCAGSPTAMLFARLGYRVLLLERSAFPSDKISTLYIQQPGVARLKRWGVLDAVVATGCPELDHVVYELDEVRVEGCAAAVDGVSSAYAPRRHLLDQILAEAAVAAGAELQERCAVTGLLRGGDRVTGVRYTLPSGKEATARAWLVVGADGMRSTVATLVDAPKTVEHPRLTCAYYTFWHGLKTYFELYEGDEGWVSAVPTNDAVLVSAYFTQDRFDEVRGDAQGAYLRSVEVNAPALFAQMRAGEQVERLRGTGDQQNFFRQAAGPGWALVGDAGHHKDSITARGIGDAFLQADLLTGHVGDRLGDEEHLAQALASYAEERDRLLTDSYRATLLVAQADARPQRKALLRAVSTSPDLTQRYFDTVAGVRPVSELYTPELRALLSPAAESTPSR
ncbi:FAD-dependent oxidoreductase [Catellatospora vulcania]|uniref:FAD-dependent oxidoreductase n=1 Tax=Catellatospora vulcania TaxID=1460450 RepID=UPI0012D425F8|nr:FAD-dependent monooxygenase [Catellatospora vulcania]